MLSLFAAASGLVSRSAVLPTSPVRAHTSMAHGEGFEGAAYGKPLSQTLGIQARLPM